MIRTKAVVLDCFMILSIQDKLVKNPSSYQIMSACITMTTNHVIVVLIKKGIVKGK